MGQETHPITSSIYLNSYGNKHFRWMKPLKIFFKCHFTVLRDSFQNWLDISLLLKMHAIWRTQDHHWAHQFLPCDTEIPSWLVRHNGGPIWNQGALFGFNSSSTFSLFLCMCVAGGGGRSGLLLGIVAVGKLSLSTVPSTCAFWSQVWEPK